MTHHRQARGRDRLRAHVVLFLLVGLLVAACGSAATLAPAPTTVAEPNPSGASESPATPTASSTPTPEAPETAEPSPTRVPATKVPPRPVKVTFKRGKETITDAATAAAVVEAKLTWQAPDGVATEFKVYGVTRCVNESSKTDGKPCLVGGLALKKADLELLETFPGTARSGVIKIRIAGEVTTNAIFEASDYFAIVLGAYNEKGESVLAIVTTSTVCWGCTY